MRTSPERSLLGLRGAAPNVRFPPVADIADQARLRDMVASLALSSLMVLASVGPTVTQIDEQRFRVGIIFDDKSPKDHASAQIALMRAAAKHCRGKGSAESEGTLYLDRADPLRPGKEALDLSEVYSCKPKD
jgi:hypothetical protein